MAKTVAVPSRWKWVTRLAGDIFIVVIIAIVTGTFRKVAEPAFQGFLCYDPRLQLPVLTTATVSNAVLYGVGFGLPAAVMIVTECFLVYKARKSEQDKDPNNQKWLPMIQKTFEAIVPFFFGGAVTHLTTNIPKYAIGRLRPNFFDACKPDWTQTRCSTADYLFVMDDVCTESKSTVDKARVSFPSGHASLSMYFMLYLIIYIQRRWTWSGCPLLRPLLQLGLFYMALYCGLSRLTDHLHHWEDILAGDTLGAVTAVLVAFKVRPVYTSPGEEKQEGIPGEEPGVTGDPTEEPEVVEDSLEAEDVKVDVEAGKQTD